MRTKINYVVNRDSDYNHITEKYNSITGRTAEIVFISKNETELNNAQDSFTEKVKEELKIDLSWFGDTDTDKNNNVIYVSTCSINVEDKQEYNDYVKETYKEWKKEYKQTTVKKESLHNSDEIISDKIETKVIRKNDTHTLYLEKTYNRKMYIIESKTHNKKYFDDLKKAHEYFSNLYSNSYIEESINKRICNYYIEAGYFYTINSMSCKFITRDIGFIYNDINKLKAFKNELIKAGITEFVLCVNNSSLMEILYNFDKINMKIDKVTSIEYINNCDTNENIKGILMTL